MIMVLESRTFLKKHLLDYNEKDNYCTGRYAGSIDCFVESFMAVSNSVYRRSSSYSRGKSKRLKQDTLKSTNFWFKHETGFVPIPYNGCLFEIMSTENWSCSMASDCKNTKINENRRRSATSCAKCSAVIQVRTVKLYLDFKIGSECKSDVKDKQNQLRTLLMQKLQCGEELQSEIVHYCRFPLNKAHIDHKDYQQTRNRLDGRIVKKIKEYASNGVHDVDTAQALLRDFVKNTLLAHLDVNELPSYDNSRYYPSDQAVWKYLVAAIGPLKQLRTKSIPVDSSPLVMNIMQHTKYEQTPPSSGIGFIALHGGAGFHSEDRRPAYKLLCDKACRTAIACLKQGGTAGEAVTVAVKVLEDSELTNAGFGSNLTEDGKIECDASVMDSSCTPDCRPVFGAVTGVSRVKNPVCAAYKLAHKQITQSRLALGRVPPCVMSGEGAESWSKAHMVEMCDKDDLKSETSKKTWRNYHRKLMEVLTSRELEEKEDKSSHRLDTVGAVAMDLFGNVASAASSGGLLMKLPGRVGQAAMHGCGCWAESGSEGRPSVAVATSGCGEQLMYVTAAKKCAENLQNPVDPYAGMQSTLLNDVLNSRYLKKDEDKQVGIIALHQSTLHSQSTIEVVWGHTTASMLVGHMSTRDNKPEVLISRLPNDASPGKSLSVSGTWIKVATETPCTLELAPPSDQDSHLSFVPSVDDKNVSASQLDGINDRLSIDSDISLMYISTNVDGLDVEDCVVELHEDFNRKIDTEFESKINLRWKERLEKNSRLFDASKFRIDSVLEIDDKLHFRLGLTSYKDYMETNWSTDVDMLRDRGTRVYSNSQALLAEPLGVAGVVVTSSDQVVFQRRSRWVAEAAGKLDVPGGHPEPAAVANLNKTSQVQMSQLRPDDVIKEIFASQLNEVNEEVNISLNEMGKPLLMGLMRNNQSGGRPVAYFIIKCSLSSNQIEDLYKRGGAETDESTQLVFRDLKDLTYMERDDPLFWNDLCPNGKAAVTLHSMLVQVKKGENPFQMRIV